MRKLKSPLNIALCVVTAVLCVVLLCSLCLWAIYSDPANELNPTVLAARDVCNVVLPLIGICIMSIIIYVRSHPKHGKE